MSKIVYVLNHEYRRMEKKGKNYHACKNPGSRIFGPRSPRISQFIDLDKLGINKAQEKH